MKAIFFGSIGSLVETSEIQRWAFNSAFEAFSLDWHWNQETYRKMLAVSGGKKRISDYAKAQSCNVDVAAIHKLKTEIFQERLWNEGFQFRDGVVDVLNLAAERSVATGLISGTEKQTVDLITTALKAQTKTVFDCVTSRAIGLASKPSPDLYAYALETLGLQPASVVAIEDNQDGLDAAVAAGLSTVSFGGANIRDITGASHDAVDGCGLASAMETIFGEKTSKT